MKIFNIGPMELVFILLILLIVLGPRDIQKYAKKLGKFLRDLTRSSLWKDVVKTTHDIQELPQKLMRESELDVAIKEVKTSLDKDVSSTRRMLLDTEKEISNSIGQPISLKPEEKAENTDPPEKPESHAG